MSMSRIALLILVVFIVEGSLVPWIIPASYGDRIIPHFTFVMVMFAALYGTRHLALIFGVVFGFLQDIMYYGHMIGTHFFIMGVIGYFTGLMLERRRVTLLMAVTTIGFACLAYDSALFYIYRVFKLGGVSYPWALIQYILPSLFLQIVFALCVYIPIRKMFESYLSKQSSSSTDEIK